MNVVISGRDDPRTVAGPAANRSCPSADSERLMLITWNSRPSIYAPVRELDQELLTIGSYVVGLITKVNDDAEKLS